MSTKLDILYSLLAETSWLPKGTQVCRGQTRQSDRANCRGQTEHNGEVGSGPTENLQEEDTVRQLLNEVQRFVGEQQAQAATVAALQRELQQAGGGNTRMDPLKLGRPLVFTGDEAACEDWAFKLKAFIILSYGARVNDGGAMDA
eukprot:3593182-Amphidinium_carterae.1